MASAAIEFRNITKIFPGVKALENVSFSVKTGEVHALIGENGAGKSTLLNLLHGVYSQYEGEICLNGEKIAFGSPHQAIQAGVAKVHQEINLVPELTVAQNITMGYEPRKRGLLDFESMNREAGEILEKPWLQFLARCTGENAQRGRNADDRYCQGAVPQCIFHFL